MALAGSLLLIGGSVAFAEANVGTNAKAGAKADTGIEFNNPLLRQRADPHVVLHKDGWYYFTATVPEYDRIELRRTRDLNRLDQAEAKVVWRKHAKGEMGAHIWAPEIHHIDGKWYIYFTAGQAEKIWEIRPYVMVNEAANPLEGEWKELGRVKTGWESFSLDATTFSHQGQRYFVWTQRGRTPEEGKGTNIYIAKMKNPTTLEGEAVLLTKPDYAWEKVKHDVNEAPSVLIRNGKVFMTYSASATDAAYALGLLTAPASANLLDPKSWTKSAEPVLKSSERTGQYGPGHNSFTTTPDGKTDLLVYHARDYRDIKGDSLRDPNRHTRAQAIRWKADGTPDFGEPVADQGKVAAKPLFRDPVHDGAADPVVVYSGDSGRWIMFYTNRRANAADAKGVTWVHGTRIGMAESLDAGATWRYIGTADIELPPGMGGDQATHWAPDVVRDDHGLWHMFLTVVPGVFETWGHPRYIVHLTSMDLRTWRDARKVTLINDKVIDAAVAKLPGGGWRMWYNNEADRKSIYYADSPDLHSWTLKGKAIHDQPGEGPKAFQWRGKWWMITDVWRGLGVYRSDDAVNWTRQPTNLLEQPGKGVDDQVKGGHADVVVSGDRAWLFYFTHPGRAQDEKRDDFEGRRSTLHVVELQQDGDWLKAERDAPARIALRHGK
jgi:GH43 family beta-xylosidase